MQNQPISTPDFHFISELLRREAAIILDQGKEYLVETRLTPVAKQAGMESLVALIDTLRRYQSPSLVQQIVEAMTTNETSFFRDHEPFEVVRTILLPELMDRNCNKRSIRIWSAAASTGQEAYSLAMMISEHFPQLSGWKLEILGTDINEAVLQRARQACYTQFEVNRGLPAPLLVKYFTKSEGNWLLSDSIKKRVSFQPLNLLDSYARLGIFDIVFMRNVLIYFDMDTKRQILRKVRQVLSPAGYLFLGAAETTLNIDENFERLVQGRCSVYQSSRSGGS